MDINRTTFILDTSAYSGFNRGDNRLLTWFNTAHTIFIPLIVIGELKAGFRAGSRQKENETLLEKFLDSANVNVISLTLETTQQFADLYLQTRQAGIAAGSNDLWIAALAREHKLPVLSLDGDFTRIHGVENIPI